MMDDIQAWKSLEQQGLVRGEQPEFETHDSPWYIKILMAFSGWLASIFLFLFMGFSLFMTLDIFDSEFAMFTLGGVTIFGAYLLLMSSKNEFIEHAGLAFSLAGQAFIAFALISGTNDQPHLLSSSFAVLQGALVFLMPSFVHRVFSATIAFYCINFTLSFLGLPYIGIGLLMLLTSWLWLHEFHYPKYQQFISAFAYGSTFSLLYIKGNLFFAQQELVLDLFGIDATIYTQPWHGQALACVALIYVTWKLASRYRLATNIHKGVLILTTLLICAASFEMTGLLLGSLLLILGYQSSHRLLMGLGILALLTFISAYYYFLDITLLEKSQTLILFGLLLLIIRWSLKKWVFIKTEAHHE